MFHLLAYTGTPGINAVNFDLTAAVDPEISTRNGHYLFTEQYQLLAAAHFEVSALRASIFAPTFNQWTRFNVYPVNRSLTTPSNPQLDWWIRYPPLVPIDEEVQVQVSNNLGAATEQANAFIWIAPTNWNQNLPAGKPPVPVLEIRLSFTTPALVANAWSGLTPVTLEQSLRTGSYAVCGMQVQGTAVSAARIVFAKSPMWQGRRMRPGTLANQSIGDIPLSFNPYNPFVFGEYGRFTNLELPQMEFWATTAGAAAVEVRMWLVYLSDQPSFSYS